MRTARWAWSQVACDNLKKAGATDEIFYYRRVLGKEKYAAHVFIAQYASQEQLKQHWESLNDNIALLYQSNVDSLLERSNFYLCFFLPESLDIIEKEKIENDAYCAKKYIFVSKKELSIEEKIRKINEKIFELTYLEPQSYFYASPEFPYLQGAEKLCIYRRKLSRLPCLTGHDICTEWNGENKHLRCTRMGSYGKDSASF